MEGTIETVRCDRCGSPAECPAIAPFPGCVQPNWDARICINCFNVWSMFPDRFQQFGWDWREVSQ